YLIKLLSRRFIFVDGIVVVFEVPVSEQGHHHPEAIELARAEKTIVPPVPCACFFFVFRMALEPDPFHMIRQCYELLATPAKVARQAFNRHFRKIVVLVREVSHCPEQTGGNWLRL